MASTASTASTARPASTGGAPSASGAVAPEGRRLLRVEARNAQTPIETKPEWLRTRAVVSQTYQEVRGLVREKNLHTVCAEANCPNIYECWNDREATFLIGGELCTRRCDFCDIATGRPTEYDVDEPRRVAVSIRDMDLRYATVTGVSRDDRPDGGAWLYAETARQIHELSPGTGVELLIPDFNVDPHALAEVFSSRPEVLGHNLETVPRIFRRIRPAFSYEGSLEVITAASEAGLVTKSNLILGMGETRQEIESAMEGLLAARCDILTITQYLRPSKLHHPIDRWVKPQEFVELSELAQEMGFAAVMSGPMVRSSYRAGMLWGRAMIKRGWPIPEHLAALAEPGTARQEASAVLAHHASLSAAS
ncbi:lipoyl synthase [Actinomyces slackii]|uniref:Lipoyl synthase n=1 Tax=Actinomyces slackii TaxID=52774 RepID=A0A448KEN3_9ACTO|nr:lipoyl synthase [Actinomyces slackii]VEG75381.1 Lipoyl synthase [Actinomyces slackii]